MGTYLNPGNGGFVRIICDNYVDKTGLISGACVNVCLIQIAGNA